MKLLNNHYYIKDAFTLDSYLNYQHKIPIFINARTVTYKMESDFHTLLDIEIYAINQNEEDEIKLWIQYDEEIKKDGYSLDIRMNRSIIIKASSNRGVRYAISILNKIVEKNNDRYLIPISFIEDEPSFMYRGIVEGYYGEPWSYEEHLAMADFMDEHRLNTFMYAPKKDPYHREKWYELYPEEELLKLKVIKENLEAKDIDFYYCISPGYVKNGEEEFDYTDEHSFDRLFTKLKQIMSMHVTNFGLFLDDIDYQLNDKSKAFFKRPGVAHAYITNRVSRFIKEKYPDSRLVMCPTEYHQIGVSEYRNDLKHHLDPDVIVFWTGDNVCAEVISKNDVKETSVAFDRDLFIWDNFPVSDFTYGVREYIAPLTNRTASLSDYALGYMINPSLHYQISKIGMITASFYSWNSAKYDSKKAFEIALKSIGDDFFEKGLPYFIFNYPNVLSYGALELEKEMIENNDTEAILEYYHNVVNSCQELLKMNYPIIEELTPWLIRVIGEEKIVQKILNQTITKIELLEFYENIKFSGSELLDNLVMAKQLFNEEEYNIYIKKRRGNPWYRVFENKRWQKK